MFRRLGDLDRYYYRPAVYFKRRGMHSGDWRGGPVRRDGWYIYAYCREPMCCRPVGPFRSKIAAQRWSRANLVADRIRWLGVAFSRIEPSDRPSRRPLKRFGLLGVKWTRRPLRGEWLTDRPGKDGADVYDPDDLSWVYSLFVDPEGAEQVLERLAHTSKSDGR